MANINVRKRAAHRQRVQAALSAILNDPAVMPNVDCPDLLVVVSQVEFGRTVREIFVRCYGLPRRPIGPGEVSHHVRYQREADLRSDGVYDDLTDLQYFGTLSALAGAELQRRLDLLYVPKIRWLPATLVSEAAEPS
jgi:hypothetical protein